MINIQRRTFDDSRPYILKIMQVIKLPCIILVHFGPNGQHESRLEGIFSIIEKRTLLSVVICYEILAQISA
jgi:hypothetical protein